MLLPGRDSEAMHSMCAWSATDTSPTRSKANAFAPRSVTVRGYPGWQLRQGTQVLCPRCQIPAIRFAVHGTEGRQPKTLQAL
jgi:hypothetical protein